MKPVLCSLALCLAACGGAQAAAPREPMDPASVPETPPAAASAPSSEAKAKGQDPVTVPTPCVKSGRFCFPEQKFSKRMCNAGSPSLALFLFCNGFGYPRGYLTRKTQAWNAAGGASD